VEGSPEDGLINKQRQEATWKAFRTLTPREQQIIGWRFGLIDGHNYTQKQVGEMQGVTPQRISQIQRKALRRLRHPNISRTLREYI
jgi:RNA polymerase primary sigma factor